MDKVLDGLTVKICCVYLDDVIVFAKNYDELYEKGYHCFWQIEESKLKIKPQKCEFLKTSLDFPGHTMSDQGVQLSDRHFESVLSWPKPASVKLF